MMLTVAFQTGEALQLLTNGKLAATPHFVSSGSSTPNSAGVSRETFAFFLQYVTSFSSLLIRACPV